MGYEPPVNADLIITFDSPKEGLEGNVRVLDIGIPEDAKLYVGPGAFVRYTRLRKDAHKGDAGSIMIIGGGPYHGAPIMAGKAAYRAGSDLVHLTVPERIYSITASACDSFIIHTAGKDAIGSEAVEVFLDMQERMHALLIGPGIARSDTTASAVKEILSETRIPVVIDADALHLIDPSNLPENTVITPHRAEFSSLFGTDVPEDIREREELVGELAERYKIIILLKGAVDIISDGKRTALNRTGVPRMAVGGTGDVLSGSAVSLIGRGMGPYYAARLAAFIVGYAGEKAFSEKSYGMIATDVIEQIPVVLKDFL